MPEAPDFDENRKSIFFTYKLKIVALCFVTEYQCDSFWAGGSHLNYSGQESKKQFEVYDCDTPVTLKQGQGHQTWFELVDPEQSYVNSVSERASDGFCQIRKHVNHLP